MRLQALIDAARKLSPRGRVDLICAVSRSLQHVYAAAEEDTPDDLTAYIYAQRAACRAKDHPISPQDAWVAATALRYDLSLVSHPSKDFAPVDRLDVIAETV
jgi:predicted nucleic acid-binding protein